MAWAPDPSTRRRWRGAPLVAAVIWAGSAVSAAGEAEMATLAETGWRRILADNSTQALERGELPGPPGEPCVWPACAKRRVPCRTKKVGTCLLPQPGCFNKQAQCEFGQCNCPAEMCAIPGTKDCMAQVKYYGDRPPPFRPSGWLSVFIALGSPDQFPKLWELEDRWYHLITPRCIPAVVLLLVGLLIAHVTGMYLCDNLFRCVCMKKLAAEHNTTICGLQWVDVEPPTRHKGDKEPSIVPVTVFLVLVFAISFWAVLSRRSNWNVSEDVIRRTVARAKSNAEDLENATFKLNDTVQNLSHGFQMVAHCEHNPLMSEIGGLAVNSTAEIVDIVALLHESVQDVPAELDKFQEEVDNSANAAVWFPCIPLLIVGFFCVVLGVEVIATRYFASGAAAAYEDRALAFCAGFFVLIIVITAIFTASALSMLVGVGQICRDIDGNVLTYAEIAPYTENVTDVSNIVRHYVKGDVFNPLATYAETVGTYIDTIEDLYHQYKNSIVTPQSISCKPLKILNIEWVKKELKSVLHICTDILKAGNVYPYYHDIIQTGVCNHLSGSLGVFLVQQVIVGLFLFPLCAIYTHEFLSHHVSAQLGEGGSSSRGLSTPWRRAGWFSGRAGEDEDDEDEEDETEEASKI